MCSKSWRDQSYYKLGRSCDIYLNRNNSVVALLLELVIYDISSDDSQISESLLLGLIINVDFLRPRVWKGRDLGIRKHFREVQSSRSPTTSWDDLVKDEI